MKITYVVTECRDKISPQCTKTFTREVKRGRPQVNCDACKSFATPVNKPVKSDKTEPVSLERECPCGTKFTVEPGRGRKASKCSACREAGTVYRTNDDGLVEAIQKDQLDREQHERDAEAGRLRAQNLFDMMAPLLKRRDRDTIPH
jgi:hypothetical protein